MRISILRFQIVIVCFFFLIHQFITWGAVADHSSYFVTIMECFGHEEFLFSFSFIFWLYRNFVFFFFFFSFRWWRGMWQGGHMIGHMMWCHRPRTWWKNLEGDVRANGVCIMALSKKWGEHEVEAWTIGQV